jgi:hypothetical protein
LDFLKSQNLKVHKAKSQFLSWLTKAKMCPKNRAVLEHPIESLGKAGLEWGEIKRANHIRL